MTFKTFPQQWTRARLAPNRPLGLPGRSFQDPNVLYGPPTHGPQSADICLSMVVTQIYAPQPRPVKPKTAPYRRPPPKPKRTAKSCEPLKVRVTGGVGFSWLFLSYFPYLYTSSRAEQGVCRDFPCPFLCLRS